MCRYFREPVPPDKRRATISTRYPVPAVNNSDDPELSRVKESNSGTQPPILTPSARLSLPTKRSQQLHVDSTSQFLVVRINYELNFDG